MSMILHHYWIKIFIMVKIITITVYFCKIISVTIMKLKELRKQNNLSQAEIAKILNTSQQNYNRYENGKIEPDLKTLYKLADFFNVSLDYLCDRQYNNKIGYIPDDKVDIIKQLLLLNSSNLAKTQAYIQSKLEDQK